MKKLNLVLIFIFLGCNFLYSSSGFEYSFDDKIKITLEKNGSHIKENGTDFYLYKKNQKIIIFHSEPKKERKLFK